MSSPDASERDTSRLHRLLPTSVPQTGARALSLLRRRGPAETGRLVRRLVVGQLFKHEAHIWYELDVGRQRIETPMPEGFALRRGAEADAAMPEAIGSVSRLAALARLEMGATLWIVTRDDEPAFTCWTFAGRAPVFAAAGGWLELPPAVHVLEDSFTSSTARGKHIAPAAWAGIAAQLREIGVRTLLTKVEIDNIGSARAVSRAGFEQVAAMELLRLGPRVRVNVSRNGAGTGRYLAERLART